jgi:hypothetical protein
MKKKNRIIIGVFTAGAIFLFIVLLWILSALEIPAGIWKTKYQPVDIITQQYNGTKKTYYHVTRLGITKKTGQFVSDELTVYHLDNIPQSDVVNGKIINKVSNPVWLDSDGKKIRDAGSLDRILEQALKIEHAIFSVKILEDKEEYFVVCKLNVNWSDPFDIYYYNQKKDELEYVTQFENEDVVGLRISTLTFDKT